MGKKARVLKYKRVLLKLSGEALLGQESYGVDPKVIERVSSEIAALSELGVEIAIVVGGGNIPRCRACCWRYR
jgi:uridylate kinase